MVNSSQTSSNFGENYITANRFYVEMGGSVAASFSECTGLDIEVETETYSEGGVNEQQRIFLKQTKFSRVTLKRGMTDDVSFWEWLEAVLQLSQATSGSSSGSSLRRNITILVFNQAGETMQSWTLVGAVPVVWKTPSLEADSGRVAIEELTLAYEGINIKAKPSGNSGSTLSGPRSSKGFFEDS